ncbi:MAG TPA: restriction endonuclease [Blastocatellia bacterium]|nr:restriction endonuclease [Blastocatellia bacterium]
MSDEIHDQILRRIDSIRREIDSWLDVPSHDGMASASLQLVYEQEEADRRLPVLRQELEVWTGALEEIERLADSTGADISRSAASFPLPLEVRAVIETVDRLTPDLISHLRNHHDDLTVMPWDVFEHLVGEWLVTTGFDDVRLVGRDARTSADLYAAHTIKPAGIPIRFFVEVKRTRRRVDVTVINTVLGAFLSERPTLGWHAALIVTSGGFANSRRYAGQQLSCLGVELRDRTDLTRWLDGYTPSSNGLWLPTPNRRMPIR